MERIAKSVRPTIKRCAAPPRAAERRSTVMDGAQAKWWDANTTAVVTGASHGIGFSIAKKLGNNGLRVVVASRDESRVKDAMSQLKNEATEATSIDGHQLDIADGHSVEEFSRWLEEHYGGADILVNNASIAFARDAFSAEEARRTMEVNVMGTINLTERLKGSIPRESMEQGRIVVLSSGSGMHALSSTSGQARERLRKAASASDIESLAKEFCESVADGSYAEKGYPASMYGLSKLLVAVYAKILNAQLGPRGVIVNSAHPGRVQTKMSNFKGDKQPIEGADTPAWLALLPPGSHGGSYWADRQEQPLDL